MSENTTPTGFEARPHKADYWKQRKSEIVGASAGAVVSMTIRKIAKSRGMLDRDGKSASIEIQYLAAVISSMIGYPLTKWLRARGW